MQHQSPLFTLPSKTKINAETLGHYPRANLLTATQLMSLHLLLHRPVDGHESDDPNFGPYISMLPQDFGSHPLTWVVHQSLGVASREECKLMDLLPPSVLAELLLLEKRFRTDWKAVRQYLDNLPELSQQHRSKGLHSELILDFMWGWINVNTRCLYDDLGLEKDDNMSLCPVFDFANHAWFRPTMEPLREGESENWQVERRSAGERGNLDLVCVSCDDRGIARDQEVTLRYGWHSNRTLFVEYGFVNAIKSEELMSGVYPGEVNVQDIVTDLLDQQGAAGTFVKKTLDAEGYWGDWTLHSSPSPAHASFRLITALRLYHTFPTRPDFGGAVSEDGMNTASRAWRDTIMGYTEDISEANEKACGETIREICRKVIERAEIGLKCVKEGEVGDEGWYGKSLGIVEQLWIEELWVAQAVLLRLS
ncbi:hypothetical protein EDB87DRAFT_1603810 [Lactarius vividus]|nr:hypothetical protein EDB87DRAFT_1603810 [Lactarius vividus]